MEVLLEMKVTAEFESEEHTLRLVWLSKKLVWTAYYAMCWNEADMIRWEPHFSIVCGGPYQAGIFWMMN